MRAALQARRSLTTEEAPVRSRFNNVVNARDVPPEDYSEPSGRYDGQRREIAEVVGARDLGYSITFVAPGNALQPVPLPPRRGGGVLRPRGPRDSCARATARARTS